MHRSGAGFYQRCNMGAWSVSVTGNDTAADLRSEYSCAFYAYDTAEALERIETYVRGMFDESEPEEWCSYVYSLAEFMWKKGILTEEVKQQALIMVDSGFGLELWAEAGEKTLQKRKAALAEFRARITSPMGPVKKIKPNIYTEDIFANGDIVACKLLTKDKPFAEHAAHMSGKNLTPEQFAAFDGKYILMQKVTCYTSWQSEIAPQIRDHWAIFRLFDGVYDEIPALPGQTARRDACFRASDSTIQTPFFCCESSMFYFKRRKYAALGNFPAPEFPYSDLRHVRQNACAVYLGVNTKWNNPDSFFLAAMPSVHP